MMPAQRTRCAQGVRMMCVCRAGSACLPAQLEQLQCSRRWPPSRNDAACTRQQAGWCGYVQRQDVTADGNGCLVSRPVAGMPAVLVKGRQALCLPLACLPAPHPQCNTNGVALEATEHGASTISISAVGRARSASGRPGGRHRPSRCRMASS